MSIYGNHELRKREFTNHPKDQVEHLTGLAHKKNKEKGHKLLEFCFGKEAEGEPDLIANKIQTLLEQIGIKEEGQNIFLKRIVYGKSKHDIGKKINRSEKHIDLSLEATLDELYKHALGLAKENKGHMSW